MKSINQYSVLPLTYGIPTSYKKSLLLELFDKGQGKEVIELLYLVDLKVEETAEKGRFKVVKLNGKRK